MTERIRARLHAALAKVDAGELTPETRTVRLMELVVRDQDVDPAALDAELRADRYPPATPIPVAEISDGRFWVFADAAAVRAWQQTRPNTSVTVAIIPLGDETETPA